MSRRIFLRHALVLSASITTLGGLTLNLSSCRKDQHDFDFNFKDELQNRIRKEEDRFSFFYNETIITSNRFNNFHRNVLKDIFKQTSYVISTNFNPFDNFFDDLVLIDKKISSLSTIINFKHPTYPSYKFYVKKVKIQNGITFPKGSKDFYMVNSEFVDRVFIKFKLNS